MRGPKWQRIVSETLSRLLAGQQVIVSQLEQIDKQGLSVIRKCVCLKSHEQGSLLRDGRTCERSPCGCDLVRRLRRVRELAMRSRLVGMGMVTAMTIVIEYYIPENFRKQSRKSIPPEQRGKIILFPAPEEEAGMRLRSRVRYMRRSRIRCSASRLGNSKGQKSLKVNLR